MERKDITGLIQRYREEIVKAEQEIHEIRKLTSRQMTLKVKSIQIDSRRFTVMTLQRVIKDLEKLVQSQIKENKEKEIETLEMSLETKNYNPIQRSILDKKLKDLKNDLLEFNQTE